MRIRSFFNPSVLFGITICLVVSHALADSLLPEDVTPRATSNQDDFASVYASGLLAPAPASVVSVFGDLNPSFTSPASNGLISSSSTEWPTSSRREPSPILQALSYASVPASIRAKDPEFSVQAGVSCAELKDCEACYNTTGCHFCEQDLQCHAYGSFYGCIYGLTCNATNPCIRTESEYRGYVRHPAQTYTAIVFIGLIIGAAVIGLLYIAYFCIGNAGAPRDSDGSDVGINSGAGGASDDVYSEDRAIINNNDGNASPSAADNTYLQMGTPRRAAPPPPPAAAGARGSLKPVSSSTSAFPGAVAVSSGAGGFNQELGWGEGLRADAATHRGSAWHGRGGVGGGHSFGIEMGPPREIHHDSGGCGGRCSRVKCCRLKTQFIILSVLVAIGVIIGITLVALFYPEGPSYSLCNTKIAWPSILNYIISSNATAEVKLQLSLYNPNRFSIRINSVRAFMAYGKEQVGEAKYENFGMPAGSVVDVPVLAQVNPSLTTASTMLYEYMKGPLFVDLTVLVDADIDVWDRRLHHVNASYVWEKTDIAAGANRELCKCK